jgi:hypothetical protein
MIFLPYTLSGIPAIKSQHNMSSFKTLETSHLVDLLAKQSSEYTKHLKDGTETMEFKLCKTWIQLLQKEINSRKPADLAISLTDLNIKFEETSSDVAVVISQQLN